jgi:hypothetical protein
MVGGKMLSEGQALFDITQESGPVEAVVLGAAFLVIVAITLASGRARRVPLQGSRAAAVLIAALGAMVSLVSSGVGFHRIRTLQYALKSGHYSVVEGPLSFYRSIPPEGHAREEVVIGDRIFSHTGHNLLGPEVANALAAGRTIELRVLYSNDSILRIEVTKSQ